MALKLNIRPDLELEIEELLPKIPVRSKTEYINRAIESYNRQLRRELELNRLKNYFEVYQKDGQKILSEFSKLKSIRY